MDLRAPVGAETTDDFAEDGGGPDLALGYIIGGRYVRIGHEDEELGAPSLDFLEQGLAGRMRHGCRDEGVLELTSSLADADGPADMVADEAHLMAAAEFLLAGISIGDPDVRIATQAGRVFRPARRSPFGGGEGRHSGRCGLDGARGGGLRRRLSDHGLFSRMLMPDSGQGAVSTHFPFVRDLWNKFVFRFIYMGSRGDLRADPPMLGVPMGPLVPQQGDFIRSDFDRKLDHP